jgi:hypothetical protein
MARARKVRKADEQPAAEEAAAKIEEVTASESPAAPEETTAPPASGVAEVDPFPRVIKRVDFGDYSIRLLQDRENDEMQIRFGEGRRQDKPSDQVLDKIRRHLVPEELKTKKEREEGKDVRWFNFSIDKGQWCMWMRNRPHIARTKAEQVFEEVIEQISSELRTSPDRSGPG